MSRDIAHRVLGLARALNLRVERVPSSGVWRFAGPGGYVRARTLKDVDLDELARLAQAERLTGRA